jgi:hypothetical protein
MYLSNVNENDVDGDKGADSVGAADASTPLDAKPYTAIPKP